MAGGKAPGQVRNGERDQAPRAAFLIAADSNGDSSSQRQAAAISDGLLTLARSAATWGYIRPEKRTVG
jgi:hypothetical protein